MKLFKLLGIIMMLVFGLSFVSCGDDDDDVESVSATKLAGRSFAYVYSGLDGDGNPEQWTTTITFKDSKNCSVNDKGSCYIWNNGYKKDTWNETRSCTYSVSGSKITLHDYPFFYEGGDAVYTYYGSYLLSSGGDVYTEK